MTAEYRRGRGQAQEITLWHYRNWISHSESVERLRSELKAMEELKARAASVLGRGIASHFGVRIGARVTRGRGRPGVITDIVWKPSHSVVVLIVKLDEVSTQRSLPLDARGTDGYDGWELETEVPSP